MHLRLSAFNFDASQVAFHVRTLLSQLEISLLLPYVRKARQRCGALQPKSLALNRPQRQGSALGHPCRGRSSEPRVACIGCVLLCMVDVFHVARPGTVLNKFCNVSPPSSSAPAPPSRSGLKNTLGLCSGFQTRNGHMSRMILFLAAARPVGWLVCDRAAVALNPKP